jgi:hypothetical protein
MHYLKQNLRTRFTHGSITEYICTAESGSVEKEQTLPKTINLLDGNQHLIHRMISSKTIQKPASIA